MSISNWKPIIKGALRGFFSVTLPSGLILHNCTVYEKEGRRWVSGPSRQYKVGDATKYEPLVEFTNKSTRDKFSAAVIAALDAHLEAVR